MRVFKVASLLAAQTIILVSLTTIVVTMRNTNPPFSSVGIPGVAATVDYDRIDTIIQQKISALPLPKNGANGQNGADGRNGLDGKDGGDGAKGDSGDIGPPGLTIQIRTNPNTGMVECRIVGDDIWKSTAGGQTCP